MISKNKANELLNYLVGGASLSTMSSVYLGLSATEPAAADGAVAGEPAAASYARIPVYATKTSGGQTITTNDAFGSASGGIISNSEDIQMAAARESWGTMNYWFLSTSNAKAGAAFLWGKLFDRDGNEGVSVGAETVPVFYAGQLKASIDVPLT